ncbi:hypothetical protein B0H10DRAFT_2213253 [Mycena sp. CBHHK59/15]|nr:hypothetical protein B0H10DRAFT_2213253 [Mycena sp. CBHHK59/15]
MFPWLFPYGFGGIGHPAHKNRMSPRKKLRESFESGVLRISKAEYERQMDTLKPKPPKVDSAMKQPTLGDMFKKRARAVSVSSDEILEILPQLVETLAIGAIGAGRLRRLTYGHVIPISVTFFTAAPANTGMALSSEDYEAFGVASECFCNEKDFNFPQTEALMAAVFGADRTSPAAKGWAAYWSALGAAEEAGTELPPFPLIDGSSPDVEMADGTAASGSQLVLSNTVLTSAKEDRERERAERKKNGNQHGKGKKKTGCTPSDLMASVFIERQVMNSKNEMKAMYYCIGCDREVRNNTQARNAPHMLGCKLLQRDFPAAWKELKDSIAPSAEQVASSDAPAPALRSKKRKLENPAEGRAPVQGITTPSHAESSGSTPTAQHTLDDTWGASSITATRQSIIDYLLLRLIVCCTLAFSLCDNGFFIDFCNTLYVPSHFTLAATDVVSQMPELVWLARMDMYHSP